MAQKTRGLVARSWRGFAFLAAAVCLPLHAAAIINVPADIPTIQAAITAAAPGDTIQVAAGTYTEQLVITKNLTISGAGSATTIIQAPTTMIADPVLGGGGSIVVVNTGAAVSMSGFTVQGPGTSCGVSFGVSVYGNATLTFDGNHVTSIRNQPLDPVNCGRAIQAGFINTSQVGNLIVTNTTVDGYQKNGIVISGPGSTGTISNTTVTGDGADTVIAQNGIVIIGSATATITGNHVSGNDCDEASCNADPTLGDQAVGINIFSAGIVTMSGNTVTGNDTGINEFDTAATATSSSDTLTGNRYENIFVEGGTLNMQGGVVGPPSNYAIYALSRAGNARNSTVVVEDYCLSSIAGPQLANTVAGSATTASIVLGTCGTMTVTGAFTPGSEVTYTIVLNNSGTVALADNPGDEFTDVLPAALTLVNALSDSGTALATIGTNTVTWNGAIAAAASVTITITATLSAAATPGVTVDNQGNIATDLNGDGTNETARTTGATAGTEGPTTFTVAAITPVRLQSFDVE